MKKLFSILMHILQRSAKPLALILPLILLSASNASADGGGMIEGAICDIVALLSSTTGLALATVAVIFLGIGALMAKVEWKTAFVVITGIALLMGSQSIVNAIGGDGTCDATQPPAPPQVTDCANNMEQYGLSVGMVYCFRQDITNATDTYIIMLTDALEVYRWALITFAIALLGIKLLTLGHQDILREGSMMIFKIAISLFIIFNAQNLYDIETGSMGEMIGWVSSGFQSIFTAGGETDTAGDGAGTDGDTGTQNNVTLANGCTPPDLPVGVDPNEYIVWEAFDCLFKEMFGTVTTPSAVNSSMLMVVGLSLLSSTLGVMGTVLGITAFVKIVMMLIKSLFSVLMAYLALGFLMILTPLIAPLLAFDSQYTMQLFKKWIGNILGTMLQPVFVIAYLSFAIMVIDEFIDGGQNQNAADCNVTAPAATDTGGDAPAANNGTSAGPCSCNIGSSPATGKGVCSFKQLFDMNNLQNIVEVNDKSNSWKVPADMFEAFTKNNAGAAAGNQQTMNGVNVSTTNNTQFRTGMLTAMKTNVIPRMHQFLAFAGDFSIEGFSRLSEARMPNGQMLQLMILLIAFTITVSILYQLANEIPDMIGSMVRMVGLNLYGIAGAKLESFTDGGIAGAKSGMMRTASGKGLLNGNLGGITGLPSVIKNGGAGMLAGFRNAIGGG